MPGKTECLFAKVTVKPKKVAAETNLAAVKSQKLPTFCGADQIYSGKLVGYSENVGRPLKSRRILGKSRHRNRKRGRLLGKSCRGPGKVVGYSSKMAGTREKPPGTRKKCRVLENRSRLLGKSRRVPGKNSCAPGKSVVYSIKVSVDPRKVVGFSGKVRY